MNKLEAKVTSIDSLENLTIVQFKFNGNYLINDEFRTFKY